MTKDQTNSSRADALRNRERVLGAADRLLRQSPRATLADIATAAGVSRATLYRHFGSREALEEALAERPLHDPPQAEDEPLPPGHLGRGRSVALDAIQVFDVVPPALLPEQLVAEAERVARVPVALYVLDIDGTHLLHMAGPSRLGRLVPTPLAIGPELDADGLASIRQHLGDGVGEIFPLWLRGRAIGLLIALGRPVEPLTDTARQAAAAITLADRYTDVFAQAQRRKQPQAAAEIQQSLLPPRILRVTGGEVAGNVLPSYEVAGDWFDVVENPDGIWITLADGLGDSTRAAASSAVALGALRASRRSGADIAEALIVMHQTLRLMPGPHSEMTAVVAHWDPASGTLRVADCGHVAPVIMRASGEAVPMEFRKGHGLGGRATPKPVEKRSQLEPGDRMVMVSDGVVKCGPGKAELGTDGLVAAAASAEKGAAPDTVRAIHQAVLEKSGGELGDDATAVCLALG